MKQRASIAILFVALSIPLVSPASCEKVRLDEMQTSGRPGSMQFSPPTNQHTTQDCYAHSAAYLLNAFLHSSNPEESKRRFSPETIYAGISQDPVRYASSHGRICDAIQSVKDHGTCDYDHSIEYAQELYKRQLEYFDIFSVIGDLYKSIGNSSPTLIKQSARESFRKFKCEKNQVDELAENVLKAAIKADERVGLRFIFQHIQSRCQAEGHWMTFDGKPLAEIPNCLRFAYRDTLSNDGKRELHSVAELKAETDRVLKAGQPAGIAFCKAILFKSGAKNYIKNRSFPADIVEHEDYDWSKNYESDCGHHSSVIIGHEPIGGKCYYVVEGTWGTDQFGFADDVFAHDGKFWVPEDKLFNNTYKVESLQSESGAKQ